MTIFDSVGNKYVIDVEMKYQKAADPPVEGDQDKWVMSIRPMAFSNGDRSKGIPIGISDNGAIEFLNPSNVAANRPPLPIGHMIFDEYGKPKELIALEGALTSANPMQLAISIKPGPQPNELVPDAVFGGNVTTTSVENATANMENAIKIDFSGLTQFGTQGSDAISQAKDGNAPGSLSGISIGTDGTIIGRYTNGQVKALAKIPVAHFKNPAGLEKVGESLYVATGNSGEFNGTGNDITERGGSILGGVLEMSNVDLSNEFVEMITTQRGFQANSRIISTSDEMLQELVNLKR